MTGAYETIAVMIAGVLMLFAALGKRRLEFRPPDQAAARVRALLDLLRKGGPR